MRRVYSGNVPVKVKKAFAERLRQARVKGETGTAEYKHIMELRAQGAITEQIARNALRKRKVSSETFKNPEQEFLDRANYWKKWGLEMSSTYQRTMKLYREGKLKSIDTALPRVKGYSRKKERLSALIEANKEYIYEGASVGDSADKYIFEDIVDVNRDMFDKDVIDEYIKLFEDYEKNKKLVVAKYEAEMKREKE